MVGERPQSRGMGPPKCDSAAAELPQNPQTVKAPPLGWPFKAPPVKAPPPVLLQGGAVPKRGPAPVVGAHGPRPLVKPPPAGIRPALPKQA